jgi:hypothetical protein
MPRHTLHGVEDAPVLDAARDELIVDPTFAHDFRRRLSFGWQAMP